MEDNLYQTTTDNSNGGTQQVTMANPLYTDVTGSLGIWEVCEDDTIY